jgi:hypothetical protein
VERKDVDVGAVAGQRRVGRGEQRIVGFPLNGDRNRRVGTPTSRMNAPDTICIYGTSTTKSTLPCSRRRCSASAAYWSGPLLGT